MVNTFSPFLRGSVHRKLYRACAFSGMINCVINRKSSAWRNQIFQGSFSCIYGGIEKVYQCRASCFSRRLHGDNEVNVSEFAVYPAGSHPYVGSHGFAVLNSNYKMLKSRRYCIGDMLKQTEIQIPLSIMATTRKRVSPLGAHGCTLLSHPGNFHLGSVFPLDACRAAPSLWQPSIPQGSRL